MTELKTTRNRGSVTKFLGGLEDETRRKDARRLLALMKEATGEKPAMWGDSIVGFGAYRYKYASGREGDWFLAGFSPRKGSLTLYLMSGLSRYGDLLEKLGRHKRSKSCLYINRLDDVDAKVLGRLIRESVTALRKGVKPHYE